MDLISCEHEAKFLEKKITVYLNFLLFISTDLSLSQAIKAKNFLSKCLYESLFQDVVFVINANLSNQPSNQQQTQMKVNMVDIAGFGKFICKWSYELILNHDTGFILESFEKNYFEQICINYINEKIQQMFVKIMLKAEQNWYAEERLEVPIIPFLDNSRILGKH